MGDIIAARRRQAQASKSNRIERVRENGHSITEPQRKIENLWRKEILLVFSVALRLCGQFISAVTSRALVCY